MAISLATAAPDVGSTTSLTGSPGSVITLMGGDNFTNAALVPVADITTTTTTTRCGIGCAINAKYESSHLSSFIEFSAYSMTSAVQNLVGSDLVPEGECSTTTASPVTTTVRTIKMNKTLSGTDLDNFAATQIEYLLGYSGCFANAVLATLVSERSSSSSGSASPSSTSLPLPANTLLSATTSAGLEPNPSGSRLKRPAVIALSTIVPIVIALLLFAGVLFYRRRRLRTGQTSSQFTSPMKDGDYTPTTMLKPELHAEQSRYEMPAEPSRYEISGKSDHDENRTHHSEIQELRGMEPSGELSTSRSSKSSLQ